MTSIMIAGGDPKGRIPNPLKVLIRNSDRMQREHEASESPEQERQEHDSQPAVEPQMVGYRDSAEVCKSCARFARPESHCELLEMTVDPQGGCMAFVTSEGVGGLTEGEETNTDAERQE